MSKDGTLWLLVAIPPIFKIISVVLLNIVEVGYDLNYVRKRYHTDIKRNKKEVQYHLSPQDTVQNIKAAFEGLEFVVLRVFVFALMAFLYYSSKFDLL